MNESQLTARIESLEKKNRRLVQIGGLALLAIGGLGAMSMRATCNSVSAERFVLLDAQGHKRALLTAYETNGAPQLALYDAKGRAVATLGVEKTGAFLALADGNAEKSVRYGVGCNATGESGGSGCNKTDAEKPTGESKNAGSTMAEDGGSTMAEDDAR
jgi:hypothetical protein